MNKLLISIKGSKLIATGKTESNEVSIKIEDCFGSAYIYLNEQAASQLKSHLDDCFCNSGAIPRRTVKVRSFFAVLAAVVIINSAILYLLI